MIIMYTIYYTIKARLRSYGYAKWDSKLILYYLLGYISSN